MTSAFIQLESFWELLAHDLRSHPILFLVTSLGWEATSWLDPGSHDFGSQHDNPGLLFHQRAVYGACLPRTNGQNRKN